MIPEMISPLDERGLCSPCSSYRYIPSTQGGLLNGCMCPSIGTSVLICVGTTKNLSSLDLLTGHHTEVGILVKVPIQAPPSLPRAVHLTHWQLKGQFCIGSHKTHTYFITYINLHSKYIINKCREHEKASSPSFDTTPSPPNTAALKQPSMDSHTKTACFLDNSWNCGNLIQTSDPFCCFLPGIYLKKDSE